MFDRERLKSFIKDPRTLRDFEDLLFAVEQALPNQIATQSASDISQLSGSIAEAQDAALQAEAIAQSAMALAQSIGNVEAVANDAMMMASMPIHEPSGFTGTFQSAALDTVYVENGIIVRIA